MSGPGNYNLYGCKHCCQTHNGPTRLIRVSFIKFLELNNAFLFSVTRLDGIDVFLHGLDLGFLSDILKVITVYLLKCMFNTPDMGHYALSILKFMIFVT